MTKNTNRKGLIFIGLFALALLIICLYFYLDGESKVKICDRITKENCKHYECRYDLYANDMNKMMYNNCVSEIEREIKEQEWINTY